MLDFEELRVRVRRIGAERYLVLANGAAHGARTTLIENGAAELRAEANRLIEIELGHAPTGADDVSTRLRRLGRSVFDLLFGDDLDTCLRAARSQAHQQARGLRLRFDLPPELHGLPVEALRSPAEQPEQTFALDATLSIVRSLPGELPGSRLPDAGAEPDVIRLLVAIASPAGLPPIDVDVELAGLRELPELAVQTTVREHATLRDIESWLVDNAKHPAAVLLIAHGTYNTTTDEGVVLLEADGGGTDPVPGHLLSGILVRAQSLRLVVLNLCLGAWNTAKEPFAGLAQAIIGKGIPAVAAMNGMLTDHAATIFGPKLLDGICSNKTVDEATTAARQRIANLPGHTTIEWATPTLFLHEACGHGWLFKAREVLGDDESADPLRAGRAELGRFERGSGHVTLGTVVAAARFLRLQRDWRRMERVANTGRPTAEQELLITEAHVEQAWPDVERFCGALADDELDRARQVLDRVRGQLPASLLRHLDGELRAAQATAELLAGRYASLREHQLADRWDDALAACAEILAMCPNGYRDTTSWSAYGTGRTAEVAQDWVAAIAGYERCGEFADAPARLANARGRVAVGNGEWAAAHGAFDAAQRLGFTPDGWFGYVAGRVAEAAGEWDEAGRHYAGVPSGMLDAGARTRYAAGRSADDVADWTGVIEGFGELPDDFADGDVGRRRQFARANGAALRADWRSVLALLGDAADADRAGAVGLLRRTARGRLAEDEGDWASAATIYAAGGAEFDQPHRYATGRLSEMDEDWPGALAAYEALPENHRDVEHRTGYARARDAEQRADWPRAADLYAALPDDLLDAAVRARYATLRTAAAEQDWPTVPGLAESLADYRDSSSLAEYAHGRMAEQRGDWAAAIVAYQSCGPCADAAERRAHAAGRQSEADGHWSAAIAAYTTALPAVPGVRARIDRLERLLAALPWADGLTGATLVADPVALREQTFPYRALRAAGVTPASPTETVKDATYLLMEQGGINWQERVAWDLLRTPAKRLLLDARLYRVRDCDALARELSALDPAGEPSPLARVCERLSSDAPLFTLLAGNRAESIAEWRARIAERPDDLDSVHCLAVASYWHAQELEDTGAWEQATQVWRVALACWAMLVTNDEFWITWRQARAACYGHAVTPADTARLRAELGRHMISLLTGHAERHAAAGRPQEADRYHQLVLFLERELGAAQCLKEVGGLPLPNGPLVCGPAYLRLVGLVPRFGEFVATADQRPIGDTESRGAVLRQLRCSFSALATAFSHLEHHRFEHALRALPEYHERRRVELPADCAGPTAPGHGRIDDCARCQRFLAHDPAYTYLPNRSFRLLQDAVGLAVRARLSIARDLLAVRQLDRAMAELTAAIAVSANALMGPRTRQAVQRMIVGRVDALSELTMRDTVRLDEAITLIELALPVVGTPGRRPLTEKLADLLVDRGIWYGSMCIEHGLEPDITRGVAELRRAFELDPNSSWVRYNLAQSLISHSDALPARRAAPRLAVLCEGSQIVHFGLERDPASNRLLDAVRHLLDAVEPILLSERSVAELGQLIEEYGNDSVMSMDGAERAVALAAAAERRRSAGDPTGCAHLLVRAVRADPTNSRIRLALIAAVEAEIARLRAEEG